MTYALITMIDGIPEDVVLFDTREAAERYHARLAMVNAYDRICVRQVTDGDDLATHIHKVERECDVQLGCRTCGSTTDPLTTHGTCLDCTPEGDF